MAQNYEYFGKYILLEKLATGGMAEVWLARASGAGGIGKFVAIKKILPQFSDNPEFLQMFKDEAAIAINLSHSNIVSIYEFGMEHNQLFLVMDYVEGRNLRQILNKLKQTAGRFSPDQIIYMIKEVAAGLDHAHRSLNSSTGKPLNITHRDMSPQNVMITFEGECKIVDFGIAKAESQIENTKTGTLKGKFGYMSPEQAEGQVTDLRTDIFSLGICLWELLANDRLFIANNEINTLKKIRECQVPSLTKINPNIHSELERITMKALTRDRNLRYQTASAMHRDLNRFLNRQYPDFTPHDFSVFIKTLYTDEILDIRRRLIEYSKIPIKAPSQSSSKDSEDRTMVTSFPQASDLKVTRTFKKPILQTGDQATQPTLTKTETFGEGKIEATKGANTTQVTAQINKINTNQGSQPVLDLSALQSLKQIDVQISAPEALGETTQSTGPDGETLYVDSPTNGNKTSAGYQRKKSGKKQANSSMSLLIFVAVMIGTYIGANQFMPEQVADLQSVITKVLAGKERNSGKMADNYEVRKIVDPNEKAILDIPEPAAPTREQNPQPLPIDMTQTQALVINSVPAGAAIWINNTYTNAETPSRVQIPANSTFTITLKQQGYIDYIKENLTLEKTGASFTADLQRAMIGYVSVDITPSGKNVRLFINGKEIKDKIYPITRHSIPAGVPVVIEAINGIEGTTAKQTVVVKPDQLQPIRLKMSTRSPAGD